MSEERRALLTMDLARLRAGADRVVRQPRSGPEPRFPLSCAQERLWFLDQADRGSTAYVMPGGLRLHGPLDTMALRRALDEIVRRHEVLRTTFPDEGGVPVQRIGPPRPVDLPLLDLTGLPPARQPAAVDRHRDAEAATPFDLARDLLLRARLLRLAPDHHVLLLTMHHIASDGWTLGVLFRELDVLYRAFRYGAPSPLAELDVQYADYAVWQSGWLSGGRLDSQLAYWRSRLEDAPVLELPRDRPQAAERTWRGSSVPVSVPRRLRQAVTALADEAVATPYMVLLTVFAVVLARWSGQHDVVVGSPLAGRSRPELEPLAGFFVNTLALRVDTAGAPEFRTLLERVRASCADAYAHQDVPFEKLIQALRPDRSAGPVPLVQTMLALRDVAMPEPSLDGLLVERVDRAESRSSKFDLVLDLVPTPDGGLDGLVEFSTDLLDAATADRIGRAFVCVLTAAVADPRTAVDRLPLLEPAERDRIIDEQSGEGGAAAAETAPCLHTLIEQRAAQQPDRPAVQFGREVLTYRELSRRANALAYRLRALGVENEQLVGVCLRKSADMIVALLGILKAGAGYVPLDPAYPRQRVALMMADSGVRVVVTDRQAAGGGLLTAGEGAAGTPPVLVLMDEDGVRAAVPNPPEVRTRSRGIAYVIYTSGSTGTPKGSANEHGGVVNTLRGLNTTLGLTEADRMLAVSSLNYDMSVYEIFGTLLAGGCVVVPPEPDITDPERLGALLIDAGITAWSSAPALLELLADHAYERGGLPGSRLRLAVLGGDRLPPALADRLAEMLPEVRLYNLAGMTEVSYCSTYHLVRRPEPIPGSIPWGRALPNQRLYVLGPDGEPTPIGVPGELFIGGAGVRRGYWRRPVLTAERFVPDPFGPDPAGRLYRTGDAARWRTTGELEFLGRLDHQVKLRGFRIELGEIEAALTSHPQVTQCVVLLHESRGDTRLVAYLTSSSPLPPSVGELRRYLLDRLPEHMVPAAFVLVERFPLLPSGKLDRAALPDPDTDRPRLEGAYVAPTRPLEQVLAGIWADVLGLDIERVGTTDDFFELGGHSLLVTQVVSRIRDLFLIEFPIRGFLSAGTVLALAERLREALTEAGRDADEAAELVLSVSALSEDEVARRLAE
ncbi:MAG TPA: amino acid adenylation domain-containing protein [Actinocrinis sp.]